MREHGKKFNNAAKNRDILTTYQPKIALEIVPDVHLFSVSGRTLDGVTVSVNGEVVSWSYVALAGAHGLGWSFALIALAALLFHRRDFV